MLVGQCRVLLVVGVSVTAILNVFEMYCSSLVLSFAHTHVHAFPYRNHPIQVIDFGLSKKYSPSNNILTERGK
jgi:hypothetical protein